MNNKNNHMRDRSGNSTLPAISEDGDTLDFPVPPVATPNGNTRTPISSSPLRNSPTSMTQSAFSDTSSTAAATKYDEKPLNGIRDRKQIARRGGWRRLVLIAIIIILCLVGLIVGLVVGLRNRNNSNSSTTTWSATSNSSLNSTFPAGAWSISTYLSSTSTACTSDSATWRCYPYTTHNQSSTASLAQFDWTIYAFTSTSSSAPNYTISSTQNPFSLVFTNVSLSLLDSGLASERYSFSVPMNKPVVPTVALTSSNVAATCYFNQTVFIADLYTSKTANWNSTVSAAYTAYPYAVSVSQTAQPGSGVPDCRADSGGASLGNFSILTGGGECECEYANFGS